MKGSDLHQLLQQNRQSQIADIQFATVQPTVDGSSSASIAGTAQGMDMPIASGVASVPSGGNLIALRFGGGQRVFSPGVGGYI